MKKSLLIILVFAVSYTTTAQDQPLSIETQWGNWMTFIDGYKNDKYGFHNPNQGGRMELYIQDGVTNAKRFGVFTVRRDGNIGIGTNNSRAKLNIDGGSGWFSNPSLELKSKSNENAWSLIQLKGGDFDGSDDYMIGRGTKTFNNGRALTFHIPNRSTFYNNTGNYPEISFVSSGADKLGSIQSETGNWYMKGNVGVGTETPKSKLDVAGDIRTSRALLIGGAEFEAFGNNGKHVAVNVKGGTIKIEDDLNPSLGIKSSKPGVESKLDLSIATGNGHYSRLAKAGSVVLRGFSLGGDFIISNVGNTNIDFVTGTFWNQEKRMTIDNIGNIGIGTTTPDSKLTVAGNIHAEEVTIDLSVPAPDYVFLKGYDLKTIEEVANYIKKEGHLPNIPSAKVLEADGVKVGEMNMKLLEKIEELTLYTIDQEEKIQALQDVKAKNKELERRLEKIEVLLSND